MKSRFMRILGVLALTLAIAGIQSTKAHADPTAQAVHMGDSYASGTGADIDKFLPPGGSNPQAYDPATRTASNRCYRTNNAYGPLASRELGQSYRHVACSGATIPDILDGMYGEPSQLEALSASTQYVTLSAGGNDAGFVDVLQCIVLEANCNSNHAKFQQSYSMVAGYLPTRYDNLLNRVRQQAPNAQVILVGYPLILPEYSWQEMYMNAAEKAAAKQLRDGINGAMRDAAVRHGMTYVDPFAPGSPFLKKNIGPGEQGPRSVIWGIRAQIDPNRVVDISSSYHPTKNGQKQLKVIVKPALS